MAESKPANIVYSVWGTYESGVVDFIKDPLIEGKHKVLISFISEISGEDTQVDNNFRRLLALDRYNFTKREYEILLQVKEGRTNKDIADHLELNDGTVRNYISSILDKLEVKNRTEAVSKAMAEGIIISGK